MVKIDLKIPVLRITDSVECAPILLLVDVFVLHKCYLKG